MKRDIDRAVAAAGAEPPPPPTAMCGNDMAADRRQGGESLPSVLAALREFRQSVALLDS